MKTKKTYTILNILTCLFVLNILFSCQNGSELQEPTSTAEYTTLYITIDDSERTVMPESISLSNLSFKLFGSKTEETQETIQTWNNSTDIPLSAITLKSGTWDFTMNAYSAGKLVLTSTKENVFLQGESKTIKFDLDEPNELLGSIDIAFEFPVGSGNIPGAKKIVAKLIQDSDEEIEVDSQILIPEDIETDSTKRFVRYQKLNIKEGYYFLRFYIYQLENADYTNFHSTYIRVEPGLESRGRETITSIDRKHKLILDLNGGTWNENVNVPNEFSEFETLDLPIGNATFENDSWTDATLDGWYEIPTNGDLTFVPLITRLEPGFLSDKVLIAIWTIKTTEDKAQEAFENFPEGRFDIKISGPGAHGTRFALDNKNKFIVLDYSESGLEEPLANTWIFDGTYKESNSIIGLNLCNLTGIGYQKLGRLFNVKTIYFNTTIIDLGYWPIDSEYYVINYDGTKEEFDNVSIINEAIIPMDTIINCKDGTIIWTHDYFVNFHKP